MLWARGNGLSIASRSAFLRMIPPYLDGALGLNPCAPWYAGVRGSDGVSRRTCDRFARTLA